MKRILQAAILILSATCSRAAIITVNNSATAPVNPPHTYASLQTAVDGASDGDSLYVQGTNISYGDISIANKSLTLIGAGYGSNLQSNFQQRTRIGNITFTGYSSNKSIVLTGLLVEGEIAGTGAGNEVSNLVIERCAVNRLSAQVSNLIVRQSLFEPNQNGAKPFGPKVSGSAIMQNSVFSGDIGYDMDLGSSLWENNIFKRDYPYYIDYGRITNINGTGLFRNNIFNDGFDVSVSNCTFNNNVFASISSLGNGNAGTGNVFSTSPGFVNNASPSVIIGKENFCNGVDYHLAAGSAALTAGPGGTEVGIYGGTNALPATAVLNGVPAMPRITEMNLQNISVGPNGNLSVQLKAVKEN